MDSSCWKADTMWCKVMFYGLIGPASLIGVRAVPSCAKGPFSVH